MNTESRQAVWSIGMFGVGVVALAAFLFTRIHAAEKPPDLLAIRAAARKIAP